MIKSKALFKALREFPYHDFMNIVRHLDLLARNPFAGKKLSAREGRSLRVGDYRIIYIILKVEFGLVPHVVAILHRKDAYC